MEKSITIELVGICFSIYLGMAVYKHIVELTHILKHAETYNLPWKSWDLKKEGPLPKGYLKNSHAQCCDPWLGNSTIGAGQAVERFDQ